MVGCTCLWYKLITDCLVQVGAWLMHLFMVYVDYGLRYRLMHGLGLLVNFYSGISHSDSDQGIKFCSIFKVLGMRRK